MVYVKGDLSAVIFLIFIFIIIIVSCIVLTRVMGTILGVVAILIVTGFAFVNVVIRAL